MSNITITTGFTSSFTLVPDTFIEHFMPHANGEYIKVYLYMLKALRCGRQVNTSDIADALEKEEADILRALKYWEKKGIWELKTDGKEISHIYIRELDGGNKTMTGPEDISVPEEIKERAFKSSQTLPVGKKPDHAAIPEDVSLLITAAEGYFNRTMTMTDQNIILYMYDDLGLTFELIDYLFCRAVETDKTQLRYIEKVALTLHENEIKSVNEAIAFFKQSSEAVHTVMQAFGLQSRNPTTAEQKYIKKWSDTYGFDKSLIEEACSRSALNTNSGNFQYADKILTSWHEAGVSSLEDVKKLDEEHKAAAAKTPKKKSASSKSTSGFHNFEQRAGDISGLEKKLLENDS